MDTTPDHLAALIETLERLGLSEMLTAYVARGRIVRRVSWHSFERFVQAHGYRIERENGNLYGQLRLAPAPTTPDPVSVSSPAATTPPSMAPAAA